MNHTFEWEWLKWYHRIKWVVASFVIVFFLFTLLAITGIFRQETAWSSTLLNIFNMVFLLFILLLCVLAPSINGIIDYMLPYRYLESMVPRKKEDALLFHKLITNGIMSLLGASMYYLVNEVMKAFVPKGSFVFEQGGSSDLSLFLILFCVFGIVIPYLLFLFYMLTFFVNVASIFRIVLMISFFCILIGYYFFVQSQINGNQILEKIENATSMVIVLTSFFTSFRLLENKYEPR